MCAAEILVLHKCSSVRLPLLCIVAQTVEEEVDGYHMLSSCCGMHFQSLHHAVAAHSSIDFYLTARLAVTKARDQLEQPAISFCREDNILKANFSSCFIKPAYRKMKSQTLIIIQIISLFKPAKLKVDTSIFTTYFLYLVVAKKSKAIVYCPFQIYIGPYKQLRRQFP